jgi:hypothetical protein
MANYTMIALGRTGRVAHSVMAGLAANFRQAAQACLPGHLDQESTARS